MLEAPRGHLGRRELALLLLLFVADQATKVGATAALTHRLDGVGGVKRLARMYSPAEFKGADGRVYIRNYGPKSEHVLAGHAAVRYSEDELEDPGESSPFFRPWLLRSEWVVLLGLVLGLGARWCLLPGMRLAVTLLAGAALSTGFSLAAHRFSVNWLELVDIFGLTLRFNLCGIALGAGLVVASWSWLVERRRARVEAPSQEPPPPLTDALGPPAP